jgi:hypothetical protein
MEIKIINYNRSNYARNYWWIYVLLGLHGALNKGCKFLKSKKALWII